jgi:N,N'-diacetyllegionaminate synthase
MPRTHIVAEIGQNHEQSLYRAIMLAKLAKDIGADSVKFQLMIRDRRGATNKLTDSFRENNKPGLMTTDQWIELGEYCFSNGIDFFVTCFDEYSVDFVKFRLRSNKIKIASCSNTDWKLLRAVRNSGLDAIISTGFNRTYFEVRKMAEILPDATFLHCVSEYPCTDPKLEEIHHLKGVIDNPIGYSDHTIGTEFAIDAVKFYDAEMLELHFTDNQDYSEFRDHKLSKTPEEFSEIVNAIR